MRRIADINTPSQRWARLNNACLAGRRRLGRQSIYAYFKSTRNSTDMEWVARHLMPFNDPERPAERPYRMVMEEYLTALWKPHLYGKKVYRYPSRMRAAYLLIMECFDVRWPSEIL